MKLAFGKMVLATALAFTGVTGTMAAVGVNHAEAAWEFSVSYGFSGSLSKNDPAIIYVKAAPGSSVKVEIQRYSSGVWSTAYTKTMTIEADASNTWSQYITTSGTYRVKATQSTNVTYGYTFSVI